MHVLVVTHGKTLEDIKNLYRFLNIRTDAFFVNQCGEVKKEECDIDGHHVDAYCFDDIGVAKNRNHLLDVAPEGLCLCVDDDCPLEKGYEEVVKRFFDAHECDVALFNGKVPYEGNRLVHNKETKRVRKFRDVSYGGGPGLAFIGKKMKESGIRYDERLGYPNDLFIGEDSLFLKRLSESSLCFYRSEDVLFTVAIDKEDNSGYFQGYDDRFFFVKGALTKILYPHSPLLYPLYQARALAKKTGKPFGHIYRLMREGRKSVKDF